MIGIGGIGVSALARMYRGQGIGVSGSDQTESAITQALQKLGATIFVGQSADHVTDDVDLVIYSPAISNDNPELAEARRRKIETMSYPQALGRISEHAFTIAVSGTHGKTTTTAMLADVLEQDINPTVIVGSLLKNKHSNFIAGSPDYFLVEACEYKRSFLNLHPTILVITNIDADHLDYYRDIEDIKHAFQELVLKVPLDGAIVCDLEHEHIRDVVKVSKARIINYRAYLDDAIELSVPGEHNRLNASIARAVAELLHVSDTNTLKALKAFTGTWRRFEYKGKTAEGIDVYDDYAHHPTEVATTLKGAKDFFKGRPVTVVFQPHLYSRTKMFLSEFADALARADRVVIVPIYAAREVDDGSVSHTDLVDAVRTKQVEVHQADSLHDAVTFLQRHPLSNELILTMGAGDVYKVGEELVDRK